MYLEHFWLTIAGVFCSGMLSMLGIIIWVSMREQARKRTVRIKNTFDRRNPINKYALQDQQEEPDWYRVTGNWN